jgi:hypothetical protein
MRLSDRLRPDGGARWCAEHARLECVKPRRRDQGTCHQPAIKGIDRCRMHAGTPAEEAKAEGEVNLTLAALMSTQPRRHPAEILLDALHAADQLMLLSLEVDPTSVEEMQRTVEAIERAQLFATRVLGADALERLTRMQEVLWTPRGDLVAGAIKRVCDRLGVEWRTPETGVLIAEELRRDPDATPAEVPS